MPEPSPVRVYTYRTGMMRPGFVAGGFGERQLFPQLPTRELHAREIAADRRPAQVIGP